MCMSTRVQVILSEQDRERFRRLAKQEGLSLSGWLKRAGLERAAALTAPERLRSTHDLRDFFARCDERESGREPDWEEHLAVIKRSRSRGSGDPE